MSDPILQMGFYGYAAGAVAYLGLAGMLLRGWTGRVQGTLLIAGCIATTVWAVAEAYRLSMGTALESPFVGLLNHVHQGFWLAFLWALLHPEFPKRLTAPENRSQLVFGGLLVVLWLIIAVFEAVPLLIGQQFHMSARLAVVAVALLMVENILRGSPTDARWGLKFLCIGLGGMFVYDLFLYGHAWLFFAVDPSLHAARGVILTLAVPFLAIAARRNDLWRTNLTVSRSTVVHTSALFMSGAYLCLMAVAAIYVRRAGGGAGAAFQAVFLFGAIALLAVVLASRAFWANLKAFTGRHFFDLKYDYRAEWLRFSQTLSERDLELPLEIRIVRAVADVVESPSGAMWRYQNGHFALASTWHVSAESLDASDSAALAHYLQQTRSVVDIGDIESNPDKYDGFVLPASLRRVERGWIIVPLIFHDHLHGFVLLSRPRAPRVLDWEDVDLLNTMCYHAASYLAEQLAGRQLAENREFEKLNRRFAFALHDIKNLASQFALVAANFEKHGENPEFRGDMVSTLKDTSGQMKRLMRRLQGDQTAEGGRTMVVLGPLLRKLVSFDAQAAIEISDSDSADGIAVLADEDRLAAVFRHLIDNAIEAGEGNSGVRVSLHQHEAMAVIEIIDNGVGMDADFINNELFRPFRSTKKGGFGLGAFQCRDYVRELGGDIEIFSSAGSGTTVRLILPAADTQSLGGDAGVAIDQSVA